MLEKCGVRLDTYAVKPVPSVSPLLGFENEVLSLHCAAHTSGAFEQLRAQTVAEVIRALKSEPLRNVVNAHFLKR